MKPYIVAVECAIEYEGKFLIIQRPITSKHAGGLLSFPGGGLDERDEIQNTNVLISAIKREIAEEVGLIVEDKIYYITTSYFTDSVGSHVIDSIFYCLLVKTIPNVIPCKNEVSGYYWMTQEEINKAENAPEWLKRYVNLATQTNKR